MSRLSLGSTAVGGGGFNPTDLIAQFQQQQAQAQAAQKLQFDQLIATIKDLGTQTGNTFQSALDRVSGLGDTARTRTEEGGQRTLAAGQQDLISSGLSNTTLGPNLRRAVETDTQRQLSAIDEGVGAQQAGILTQQAGNQTQIGGLLANAISSQNIQGPDLGLFAGLLQQASAAGDPNARTNVSIGPGSVGGSAGQPQSSGSFSGGGGGGGGAGGSAGGPPSGSSGGGGGGGGGGARIVGPGKNNRGRGAAKGSARGAQGQVLNPGNRGGLNPFAGPTGRRITGQLGGLNF